MEKTKQNHSPMTAPKIKSLDNQKETKSIACKDNLLKFDSSPSDKEKQTKIIYMKMFFYLACICMTSILLLSIRGDIICKLNYMIGDCVYGRFILYNIVLFYFIFVLENIRLIGEKS